MDSLCPLDQTIADIAAGDHSTRTFAQFEQLAGSDPSAWQRLALTLRDELAMRSELDQHLHRDRAAAAAEIAIARAQRKTTHRFAAWSGWSMAAALLVAMMLWFTVNSNHQQIHNPVNGASLAGYTAQQALDRYVTRGTEEGRVIAELPTVMVEARELDNGLLEVLYLRQFLEREQVNEVFTLGSDELGDPQPVKLDIAGWDFDMTL